MLSYHQNIKAAKLVCVCVRVCVRVRACVRACSVSVHVVRVCVLCSGIVCVLDSVCACVSNGYILHMHACIWQFLVIAWTCILLLCRRQIRSLK